MRISKRYHHLLQEYPGTVTKEQFYKICHISKHTAQYLLSSGIVPCEDTGKKTRRYTIKIIDIIKYLELRDSFPELYQVSFNHSQSSPCIRNAEWRRKMEKRFRIILSPFPDLLSVQDICTITGYCKNTVLRWFSNQLLHPYEIRGKYLVPKETLLRFMMSCDFRSIRVKSKKHLQIIDSSMENSSAM